MNDTHACPTISRFVPRGLWTMFGAWILTVQVATCNADEPTETAKLPQEVRQWDERAEQTRQKEALLADEILVIRKQATDLQRQTRDVLQRLKQIEQQQMDLQSRLKTQQAELEKKRQVEQESEQLAAKAVEALQAAQKRVTETKAAAAQAAQKTVAVEKSIEQTTSQLKDLAEKVAPAAAAAEQADRRVATVLQTIRQLETRAEKYREERREYTRSAEQELRDRGLWVSFREEIAPVLHRRCFGCHNIRNPQGRFNVSNWKMLTTSGESADIVVPGDAASSLLFNVIDDGSMPAESDPLSEAETEKIRRWIELGARLDASVSPEVSLFQMMPREPQPAPPEKYRVPLPVTALSHFPDGDTIVSSGYHEVLLWERGSRQLSRRVANVAERVYDVNVDPTGKWLAVASGTPGQIGEAKLFSVDDGRPVQDLAVARDSLFVCRFSPDAKSLIVAGAAGSATLFVAEGDVYRKQATWDLHADWIHSVDWSPNGKRIVTASRDKSAKIVEMETGRVVSAFAQHQTEVRRAVFVDDNTVASIGGDTRLRIWQTSDGKELRNIDFGPQIVGLARLPERRLATVSADGTLAVHGCDDGKPIAETAATQSLPTSLAISGDGKTAMIGTLAGEIVECDLQELTVQAEWTATP